MFDINIIIIKLVIMRGFHKIATRKLFKGSSGKPDNLVERHKFIRQQ